MRTLKTKGQAIVKINRGRDLKNSVSYKCSINEHLACAAMRCQCECGHGVAPDRKEKTA